MPNEQYGYKLLVTEDMRSALMRAIVHRQERIEELLGLVNTDQWRKTLEDERAGLEKSFQSLLQSELEEI